MFLTRRASKAIVKRVPKSCQDYPFEVLSVMAGSLLGLVMLLDLLHEPLLSWSPGPLSITLGTSSLLSSCVLAVAIRHSDARAMSASLWMMSLVAAVLVVSSGPGAAPPRLTLIGTAVLFAYAVVGFTRAIFLGAVAKEITSIQRTFWRE